MELRPDHARLRAELDDLEAELTMTAAAVPSSTRLACLRERLRALRLALEGEAQPLQPGAS